MSPPRRRQRPSRRCERSRVPSGSSSGRCSLVGMAVFVLWSLRGGERLEQEGVPPGSWPRSAPQSSRIPARRSPSTSGVVDVQDFFTVGRCDECSSRVGASDPPGPSAGSATLGPCAQALKVPRVPTGWCSSRTSPASPSTRTCSRRTLPGEGPDEGGGREPPRNWPARPTGAASTRPAPRPPGAGEGLGADLPPEPRLAADGRRMGALGKTVFRRADRVVTRAGG